MNNLNIIGRIKLPVQKTPNIKVLATNNYHDFSVAVAAQVEQQIKNNVCSNLLLPAGHSPRGYYDLLAQQKGNINWQQIKCFALDDYLGTDEAHTFQGFLQSRLYSFTDLPDQNKFNPRFCDNYDQLIADAGGIDLCLLGLGVNGHIAFNEPPTVEKSWTHCVWLTETTKKVNQPDFAVSDTGQHRGVPERAVTVGIATILNSKRIILAVSGEHKKPILEKTLCGTQDTTVPASFLTAHTNLLVITDFAFTL